MAFSLSRAFPLSFFYLCRDSGVCPGRRARSPGVCMLERVWQGRSSSPFDAEDLERASWKEQQPRLPTGDLSPFPLSLFIRQLAVISMMLGVFPVFKTTCPSSTDRPSIRFRLLGQLCRGWLRRHHDRRKHDSWLGNIFLFSLVIHGEIVFFLNLFF